MNASEVSQLPVLTYLVWQDTEIGRVRWISLNRTRKGSHPRWCVLLEDTLVLTKRGEFIHPGMPSSRTEKAAASYFFDSPEGALANWHRHKIKAVRPYYPPDEWPELNLLLTQNQPNPGDCQPGADPTSTQECHE